MSADKCAGYSAQTENRRCPVRPRYVIASTLFGRSVENAACGRHVGWTLDALLNRTDDGGATAHEVTGVRLAVTA